MHEYALSETDLRSKLTDLEKRRLELMNAGVLDAESEAMTIAPSSIAPAVRNVLEIYVRDNEEKLDVFKGLLEKLQLFQKLVNARFLDKRLTIDRRVGFRVKAFSSLKVSKALYKWERTNTKYRLFQQETAEVLSSAG